MDLTSKLKSFLLQCTRVWHLLRKPTTEELKTVSKISAIGILIIGAVGFFISDFIKILERFFS
ncbi:protein translocase SEC61 complex subunit gamma [Candidatus Pacearchaeota archaeon]|nr:protein translocase SEC61 complex subunit gamma [Candidatus Pacearchaeota archaeon]